MALVVGVALVGPPLFFQWGIRDVFDSRGFNALKVLFTRVFLCANAEKSKFNFWRKADSRFNPLHPVMM